MLSDLELARAHFQCASDLLSTLTTLQESDVRAAVLAEARISYGAGVRRLNRPVLASEEALHAEIRRLERNVRVMLDAAEDDRTTRYFIRRDATARN